MATSVADIAAWMERLAPLVLSESWDNTGLLLGDPAADVHRVQTCLTLTPQSVSEAIGDRASMVIAHHPLPFKPLTRITTQTNAGKLLWQLAESGIAVYSPHTAWDSAAGGINALLAGKLSLLKCRPLIPLTSPEHEGLGAGRVGELARPTDVRTLASQLMELLPHSRPRGVDCGRVISRVGIACGSGGSLLPAAVDHSCDLFLTGEATFHHCLEAQADGVSLLMIGHFASEKFSMLYLAERLKEEFPALEVWTSKMEKDPVSNFR